MDTCIRLLINITASRTNSCVHVLTQELMNATYTWIIVIQMHIALTLRVALHVHADLATLEMVYHASVSV